MFEETLSSAEDTFFYGFLEVPARNPLSATSLKGISASPIGPFAHKHGIISQGSPYSPMKLPSALKLSPYSVWTPQDSFESILEEVEIRPPNNLLASSFATLRFFSPNNNNLISVD